MAARGKAPVVLATVLVFAVAGVTFASPAGTVIRMGVFNTITGTYATTLQGSVSTMILQVRNNSTGSASAAIRAYSPYGGVPLDLRARATNPVMRVSNSVKVTNLNVDRLDGLDSSDLLAKASRLAYDQLEDTGTQTAASYSWSHTITPGAVPGFIKTDGAVNVYNYGGTTCIIGATVTLDGVQETQYYRWVNPVANGYEAIPVTAARQVISAAPHTVAIVLNNVSCSSWEAWGDATSVYVPYGSTGGSTLGSATSRPKSSGVVNGQGR